MKTAKILLVVLTLGSLAVVLPAVAGKPAAGKDAAPTKPTTSAKPPVTAKAAPPVAAAPSSPVLECPIDCTTLDQRLSLFLEYELCGATQALTAAKAQGRIFLKRDADQLSSGGACLVAALKGANEGERTTELVVESTTSSRRNPANQAPSGNFSALRTCLSPLGLRGAVPRAHRDLARNALAAKAGFGHTGKLIEVASEQADTYEWDNEAAHAQTKNGSSDKATAISNFKTYLRQVTGKVRQACCDKDDHAAAYQLGYLFHAIQDLATHAGMTNEYHAYQLPRHNPDLEKGNLDRAQAWTGKLLVAYRDSGFGACAKRASKVAAAGADWNALAANGGYGVVDATPQALATFLSGAARVTEPPKDFWFDQADATEAETFFTSNALDGVKQSVATACQ